MDIIKSITEKKQRSPKQEIATSEVSELWDLLVFRYECKEKTQFLKSQTSDKDLDLIVTRGLKIINDQIKNIENKMEEYNIPLPMKPPENITTSENLEIITDRHIFRSIFRGMQSCLLLTTQSYISASNEDIRDFLKAIMNQEINLYDKFFTYGKLKGWLFTPPRYKKLD